MASRSSSADDRPWRDPDRLRELAAACSRAWSGREVFRLHAGAGWVRLALAGDDRPALCLGSRPGATLVFPFHSPLDRRLQAALGDPVRGRGPDPGRNARLGAVGVLPDDLVLTVRFEGPEGPRHLLHQLFGSPGNTVLLDATGRLLWAQRRPPHPCLQQPPPPAAYAVDAPAGPHLDELAGAWERTGLRQLAHQRETALADRLRRALQGRLAAAERLVGNLAHDLAGADRGEEIRHTAELLAAHLHEVAPGEATAVWADLRTGEPRRVALDPALSGPQNLERLFKQARKAERGRDVIETRLREAERTAAELRDRLTALDGLAAGDGPDEAAEAVLRRLAALLAFRDRHLPQAEARAPAHAADEPARPFRRYRLAAGWEVWVGRNREENDRLTHRESHPRDLWLHAQGAAGSHVILRTGGRPDRVPRDVVAQAARLAALHSKARHSALVPVIWTERRYVSKPRKTPPGTAVTLRHESLFAEPGVPDGAEPI